jgi:hypothetical protein
MSPDSIWIFSFCCFQPYDKTRKDIIWFHYAPVQVNIGPGCCFPGTFDQSFFTSRELVKFPGLTSEEQSEMFECTNCQHEQPAGNCVQDIVGNEAYTTLLDKNIEDCEGSWPGTYFLYFFSNALTMKNCRFTNSGASDANGPVPYGFITLAFFKSDILLEYVHFVTIASKRGALYIESDLENTVTLKTCEFTGLRGELMAGVSLDNVIFSRAQALTFVMENCTMHDCQTGSNGIATAIYPKASRISISDTIFTDVVTNKTSGGVFLLIGEEILSLYLYVRRSKFDNADHGEGQFSPCGFYFSL